MAKVEQTLRQKVDTFLKDALAENSEAARAKLLGKAVYWNDMAAKARGQSQMRDTGASRLR